jgi:hypothetical protein
MAAMRMAAMEMTAMDMVAMEMVAMEMAAMGVAAMVMALLLKVMGPEAGLAAWARALWSMPLGLEAMPWVVATLAA